MRNLLLILSWIISTGAFSQFDFTQNLHIGYEKNENTVVEGCFLGIQRHFFSKKNLTPFTGIEFGTSLPNYFTGKFSIGLYDRRLPLRIAGQLRLNPGVVGFEITYALKTHNKELYKNRINISSSYKSEWAFFLSTELWPVYGLNSETNTYSLFFFGVRRRSFDFRRTMVDVPAPSFK